MKTSLDHLPEDRRERLAAITARLRDEAEAAELVLLFGSYARGDWVEDPETGYRSDFDLLVVVESAAMVEDHARWSRVEAAVRALAAPTPVTLLVHDVRFLNGEIRRGQFFFAEIVAQAVVLFDSRRFQLARPKGGTPEERKAIAEEYFEHWFSTASTFLRMYESCIAIGDHAIAAFQLHQAAERYLAAALLVFTGAKPATHDLEALGKLVAPLDPRLAEPFPRASDDDDRLFKLLKKAYIESRYSKSYRVTADDLARLGARVRDLAGRVEQACREAIARLG